MFAILAENLFVQQDEKNGYLLKIGDFGSVRMPGAQTEMTAWTPEYCTPEMARLFLKRNFPGLLENLEILLSEQEIEETLQPKTDMFSAGLVVMFMYVGEHVLNQSITRAIADITDNEKRKQILLFVSSNLIYGGCLVMKFSIIFKISKMIYLAMKIINCHLSKKKKKKILLQNLNVYL